MKKLFYFHKSKINLVEIKNHKLKIAAAIAGIFVASLLITTGSFLFFQDLFSDRKFSSDREENIYLKAKLKEVVQQYKTLNENLDSLIKVNADLRLAVNLPPIENEVRSLGVGGSEFDEAISSLFSSDSYSIEESFKFIEKVSNKVAFEKQNYESIKKAFERNNELWKAIPALKPSSGTYSIDSYGMRKHPILGVFKKHEGIDIITDIGTPVFAPGNGRVEFVGRRAGLGLAIEINHGFGYKTVFGHLSKTMVQEGTTIKRGMKIGLTGNSGLSTGPHLHYEILHNGINVNPIDFFFDDLAIFN